MDFLNNIWTAISTPNESLINIMMIPCSIIENILVVYMAMYLLKISATKKQKILYVSLASIEGLITLIFIPAPYNSLINYLLAFCIFKYSFKVSVIKSLIGIIVPTIMFGLIGTLVLNPFVK